MEKKVFYHEDGQIDLVKTFEYENPNFSSKSKRGRSSKASNYSLEPYNGEWGNSQLQHLLNRALLGVSSQEIDYFKEMSLNEILEVLFTPQENIGLPVNDYYDIFPGDPDAQPGETWLNSYSDQFASPRHESLKNWMFYNQTKITTSIQWTIVYFLNNFVVADLYANGGNANYAYFYYKLLFDSAFGSYKDFIYEVTINGKMLWYLNLEFSKVDAPDENYARELQELYTVGKGPGSKFTENDVVEMSKILVGWNSGWGEHTKTGQNTVYFEHRNHDKSDKQLSSFYNNKLIKGRFGDDGSEELTELIDTIFNVDETSKYICRRVYQFFVNPILDDQIELNIISPLAEILKNNNFEIKVILKILLKSEHFFDHSLSHSLIKSPFHSISKLLKEFDYRLVNSQNRPIDNLNGESTSIEIWMVKIKFYQGFYRALADQGMNYLQFPTVAGHAPYYQSPNYDLFWINSYTSNKRSEFFFNLIRQGIGYRDNTHFKPDLIKWVKTFQSPQDLDSIFSEAVRRLIGFELDDNVNQNLKSFLLNGIDKNHWTELWQREADLSFPNNQTLENQLIRFVSNLMKLNEFNLY